MNEVCIVNECSNIAFYNYLTVSYPLYCRLHYKPNMFIVYDRSCIIPACSSLKYSYSNFCHKHTHRSFICKVPTCLNIVNSITTLPSVCPDHRKEYIFYKHSKLLDSYGYNDSDGDSDNDPFAFDWNKLL